MTNHLQLVQGADEAFEIDLTDEYGEALASDRLVDAVIELLVRETAEGPNVLAFTSPDATHLTLTPSASLLAITFLAADTAPLALGEYVYQVKITCTDGEVLLPIEWTPIDIVLGGSAEPAPPVFDNVVKINHDYPLTDDLRYMTPGGSPIANAQIRVYKKADYDAGFLLSPVGITLTDAAGRWSTSILVEPGFEYVIQFFKPNEFGPDIARITALA